MNIKEELKKPGVKRVILDTVPTTRLTSQFALALSMLAEDRINLVCVTAAPFHNEKSNSFADGMERSYREIGICTSLVAKSHGTKVPPYYRGSTERMPDESTPVGQRGGSRYCTSHNGIRRDDIRSCNRSYHKRRVPLCFSIPR